MRILAIGDPHGELNKIKKIPLKGVNLILLTGDLGKADLARKRYFENVERAKKGLKEIKETSSHVRRMNLEIYNSTINILKFLSKYSSVYFIQGNVDFIDKKQAKKEYKQWKIKLPLTLDFIKNLKKANLIKNKLKIINRIKIGFLEYFIDECWVKEFRREFNSQDYKRTMKIARKQTNNAKKILKNFGKIDILVCHQPPYGILDEVGVPAPIDWRGKHAGSKTILNYIKKYKPRYVFCGHIHEGKGMKRVGKTEVYNLGVAGHKIIEIN